MSKDKLTDYDATASNNTDVGGISVAEGMLPSGVNNAIREQMSHLKDFASGTTGIDVLSLADDDASHAIKLQAPSAVTADTTFTLPDGDGTADQVLKTDGSGQLGWAAQTAVASNPSLIINGGMTVAQRAVSVTGKTSSGYFTCDRWNVNIDTIGTWSFDQSSTVPSGEGFATSLKVSCTAADASPAAGDSIFIQQRIEGQDLQHLKKGTSNAESVTLSFWVRSSKTGTHIVEIRDDINTRHIAKSYSIATANTWQYVTLAYDGDTSGTLTNSNIRAIDLNFWLGAGSDFTSGTLATSWASRTLTNSAVGQVNLADSSSNEWYITGVKLEVGSTATNFQHLSYGDELIKCQRYFELLGHAVSTGGQGYTFMSLSFNGSSTNQWLDVEFKVEKRAAPSSVDSVNGYSVPSPTAAGIGINGFTFYKASQMLFNKAGGSDGDVVASVSAEL